MGQPGELYNAYQKAKATVKKTVKTVGNSAKLVGKIGKGIGKAIIGSDLPKSPKKYKLKGDYHAKAQQFIKKSKAKGYAVKAKNGMLVASK